MPRKSKYDGLYEVGHKFGEWELLSETPVRVERKKRNPNSKGRNRHSLHYRVKCSCEAEQTVDCYNLEKGVTTMCYDCSMKDRKYGSNNANWKGGEVLSGRKFYRITRGAELRGIPMEISLQDAENKLIEQNYICALTGLELNKETWSLDRIDSKTPYQVDNIQWVHKDINVMKNKFDEEYFIEMCRKVSANN